MNRVLLRAALLGVFLTTAIGLSAQGIRSDYLDLPLPGQWQVVTGDGATGVQTYYDAQSGSLLQIGALAGMQKVAEISKYFQHPDQAGTAVSQLLANMAFPLPDAYSHRVSKDLVNGTTPPRMWEVKDGEGSATWFYTSQLFGQYNIRNVNGASEVQEEYMPARVLKAEHESVKGGDALVLELETEHPATEQALKRFHMPAGFKDQRIRFSWIQYAPGGVAAGQGVLSVVAATAANSDLTSTELLTQISSAKLKPME